MKDLMQLLNTTLIPLIKEFETESWIKGFNFGFYSGVDEHLSLRLDLKKKHEHEIKTAFNKLHIKPTLEEYKERDKIAKFYELGSRWAFVLQDQVDRRRFQKEWMKEDNFILAIHGLCNSLFLGYYEEIQLHLKAIGMIGLTLGRFNEIKNDLKALNEKCMQWFLKP